MLFNKVSICLACTTYVYLVHLVSWTCQNQPLEYEVINISSLQQPNIPRYLMDALTSTNLF